MQVLTSVRASKSLPLLKRKARGWSDARISFEIEWLAEQWTALEDERRLRKPHVKAAGG